MSPSLKYLIVSSIAARNASSDPMSLTATLGVEVACVLLVMSLWAPDADRDECCAERTQGVNARDLPPVRRHSRVAAGTCPGGLTTRRPAFANRVAATRPHEDTAQSSGYVVLAGRSIEPGYNSVSPAGGRPSAPPITGAATPPSPCGGGRRLPRG